MSFSAENLAKENERIAGLVPDIMEAWTNTFRNKNSNYGNSWLLTGQTISLWFPQGVKLDTVRKQVVHGLLTRMLDKIIRFAHLELLGEDDKVGEKSAETVGDLGVYGFMASAFTSPPKGDDDQSSQE